MLPGTDESYWIDTTPRTDYPALPGDVSADAAVPSAEASSEPRCSSSLFVVRKVDVRHLLIHPGQSSRRGGLSAGIILLVGEA